MNKNWLFLRGDWDCRTHKSITDDDDMWIQLFKELCSDVSDTGVIHFCSPDKRFRGQSGHIISSGKTIANETSLVTTHILSRGGFQWQAKIVRDHPKAYAIRYGAGRRFMPEPGIKYDLVLVDSERQKTEVLQKYPKANVHLLIKPAAYHFKPVECEKEYDVCFIAKDPQASFKGVKWVYDTVPKNIKVLHLGSDGRYDPPENVTCKTVDRIDMPNWISKCKIGVVPYWNKIDSCPRIIPEMMACGLPLVVADELSFWDVMYPVILSNKRMFWEIVDCAKNLNHKHGQLVAKNYENYLSISKAAQYIKNIIEGN